MHVVDRIYMDILVTYITFGYTSMTKRSTWCIIKMIFWLLKWRFICSLLLWVPIDEPILMALVLSSYNFYILYLKLSTKSREFTLEKKFKRASTYLDHDIIFQILISSFILLNQRNCWPFLDKQYHSRSWNNYYVIGLSYISKLQSLRSFKNILLNWVSIWRDHC